MESVLDEKSVEVAATVAGHVAKKIIKRSKCESCKILLKAGDAYITNDAYLNIFFPRGGLFVPSKSLADFVCSNFAILDFFETDIVALSLPVKTSATSVFCRHGSESDFTCVNHLDWGFNFANKIFLATNRDCQEILSIRKVLLVLRNVKERNKQYLSLCLLRK